MGGSGPISLLSRAGNAALDIVYPRACEGCGAYMRDEGYLCWDCLRQAEKIARPFCERCGDPVDGLIEGSYVCSWCARNRPCFEQARSVFRYSGPIMRAIQQFKYSGGLHLAKEMAEVMAAAVSSFYSGVTFDLVLGVPLFARKERERGYNQAALLADKISRVLGVDSFNRAASRIRDTGTQTELKASQRKKNVRGAFNIEQRDWISERHILVVDDVITTGATVAELSRALKEEGAGSVRVISLARG